MLNIVYVVANQ